MPRDGTSDDVVELVDRNGHRETETETETHVEGNYGSDGRRSKW